MKGSTEDEQNIDVVIATPVAMETPAESPKPPKLKSVGDAYVLCLPLGFLGIHHFYLGSPALGIAYLFTLGCGGIGVLVDLCRMPTLVKDANRRIEKKWKMQNKNPTSRDENVVRYELDIKRLSDCYILGFVTGFLGFHHFFLRRRGWGFLYLFTLGLLGCGVISDWIRMPLLYKRYKTNLKLKAEGRDEDFAKERYLDDAYTLCFPFGILGFHHFYLKRPCWGFLYMFTLGMLGLGFLIDMIRMKSLVDETNRMLKADSERRKLLSATTSVTYTIDTANGPPGAPGSYQTPNSNPGVASPEIPPPGYPGYPPPPQSHAGELIPPPAYTPVADSTSSMPDPDGVPVNKPGI